MNMAKVTERPRRRRAAVLTMLWALQVGCQQLPATGHTEARVQERWSLEAALASGKDARPEELWLFLRSHATSSLSMVCADAWALKIQGRTIGQPIGRDSRCTDFAAFVPIPPGGTLTVRIPSTAARADANFDGLSLVIVEASWTGSGREYREVHWNGTFEDMMKAGQRLLNP